MYFCTLARKENMLEGKETVFIAHWVFMSIN